MKPVILAYSETNDKNIAERIGMSEYSYYFVLKWFLPTLAELGEVKVIYDPLTQADLEYDQAQQEGRQCVLFSFAPPHRTLFPQRCPVVPLVAWEFERIPDHQWDNDPTHDWRHVFARTGLAITHSEFARQAILRAMTPDYPVWSIPAPVWDRFAARGMQLHGTEGRRPAKGMDLHIKGAVFDSATCIPNSPETAQWRVPGSECAPVPPALESPPLDPITERKLRRAARRKRSMQKLMARLTGRPFPAPQETAIAPTQEPPAIDEEHHIQAKGIVFASILNSRDGRKNWGDLATAFASRFQDVEDAVLIFKLNENDSAESMLNLERDLRRFVWLKCRVIAFNGYLSDDDYQRFLDGIDYVVNASTGEGQCLPLMELMAMGTPAIAPDHTSMADYITPDNAFILPSTRFLTGWPHDPRFIYSTTAFRVPWDALRDAYGNAYQLAKTDPSAYQRMSSSATAQLESHSSKRVVLTALRQVLEASQLRQNPANAMAH